MSRAILGIDVSKATLYLALLEGKGKPKKRQVSNNAAGFALLDEWLKAEQVSPIHACLEATSTYGNAVARHLHQLGHQVSIINPSRIKGFAQSELSRTKTDSADAGVIARFGAAMAPKAWQPPTVEAEALQQMTRRIEDLQQMIVQEKNRQETASEILEKESSCLFSFLKRQNAYWVVILASGVRDSIIIYHPLVLLAQVALISLKRPRIIAFSQFSDFQWVQ